jgi:predicted nuclease of predicted toxin-antitoxin system
MKLLIDECLPRALKRLLGDHECRTVQEMGWSGKKNGVLLSLAEREFDVLVTVDQGMEYEQDLASRKMAVLVLAARSIRSKIWSPSSQQLLLLFAASILGARFGLGHK